MQAAHTQNILGKVKLEYEGGGGGAEREKQGKKYKVGADRGLIKDCRGRKTKDQIYQNIKDQIKTLLNPYTLLPRD